MQNIGNLGENLVASWLKTQNQELLHQNWYCPWGEIDLIAQDKSTATLIFVEVKTRSRNNWDKFGLLSITPQKQQKIVKTASLFLSRNPQLAEFPCRFDIALVSYKPCKDRVDISNFKTFKPKDISLGKPVIYPQGYQLTLQTYLQSAFDLS